MTTVIKIAPSLDLALVVLRGIVQVDTKQAKANCQCGNGTCWGFCMDDLPLDLRHLELKFRGLTDQWLARMSTQGFDAVGSDVRIHGPFASYDFIHRMEDVGNPAWKEALRPDQNGDTHPELALPYVFERDSAPGFKDYVLVHQFLKRNVLTEVPLDPS